MVTVELAPAYSWDCPGCGRENFQRAISQFLDPEDEGDAEVIREMEDLGPDDPIPGDLRAYHVQTRPDRVTCRHCGVEYRAVDTHSRDPGDPE